MDGPDRCWLPFGRGRGIAVLGGPKTCQLIRRSSLPVMLSRPLAAMQATPGEQTGGRVGAEVSDSIPAKIILGAFMFVCVDQPFYSDPVSGMKYVCVFRCGCLLCVCVCVCEKAHQ